MCELQVVLKGLLGSRVLHAWRTWRAWRAWHAWRAPRFLIAGTMSAALTISQMGASLAAPDSEMVAAVALYNHQQYAAALQAFESIAQKNPSSPSPLYYSANCDLGLGHTTAALVLYRRIIDSFPQSAEASSARTILQRMGIRYGGESGRATRGTDTGPGSSSGVAAGTSPPMRRVITAEKKDAIIDKMVVPVRALAGRPEVDALTIESVKEALRKYPTSLLAVLHDKHCRIYVTPTMIDKEPQLVNSQPAGYEEGSTFKNCPGMFNGNVILCEYRFVGDGPDLMKMPDITGTLRHELGHAVDWYLGDLTAKDDYKHQYLLDLGTIDDGVKNKLAYFCQKDRRGPAETFAELMCCKYGGRASDDRTAMVDGSFKLTKAYVAKVIDQVADSK